MNIDIRAAIIHNLSGNDKSQIKDTILDAISNGEEKMLPGLGVLFELAWKNSPPDLQEQIITQIKENL